jgi:tetratricopeptide (TPR) repeat protein
MMRQMRSPGLLGALVCVLLALTASSARATPISLATAADKNAAREAYRQGQGLFDKGDYAGALRAFERGHAAYEDPSFLFNIAQCHRFLGHKREAVKHYRDFLAAVPAPPNLADIQGWLAELDAQIESEASRGEERSSSASAQVADRSSEPVPTYKKWWPWTIAAGGVLVLGLGLGLGLGLRKAPAFNQTLTDFGPGVTKAAAAVVEVRF